MASLEGIPTVLSHQYLPAFQPQLLHTKATTSALALPLGNMRQYSYMTAAEGRGVVGRELCVPHDLLCDLQVSLLPSRAVEENALIACVQASFRYLSVWHLSVECGGHYTLPFAQAAKYFGMALHHEEHWPHTLQWILRCK